MSRKRGPSTNHDGPITKKLKPSHHPDRVKLTQPPLPPIVISNPLGALEQSRIAQLKKIENDWRKVISHSSTSGTLQKELEQLRTLSHPHYLQHTKTLEKERDDKLQLLFEWKDQQLATIEQTLSAGIQGANDEFMTNVETAKEALFKVCEMEKEKLEEQKTNSAIRRARNGSKSLQKSGLGEEAIQFATSSVKTCVSLSSDEIKRDLQDIKMILDPKMKEDQNNFQQQTIETNTTNGAVSGSPVNGARGGSPVNGSAQRTDTSNTTKSIQESTNSNKGIEAH